MKPTEKTTDQKKTQPSSSSKTKSTLKNSGNTSTKKNKATIKPNGKVKKAKQPNIRSLSKANEVLEEGIQVFEDVQRKLEDKLKRAEKVIAEIRQLSEEKGITMPELQKVVDDSNRLQVYSAKLTQYLDRVRDEKADMDQRVAMLGVMVDISNKVDQTELPEEKADQPESPEEKE